MKLLICDDDISTIDFIQNSLDCHEFGITRILRAYNGITAKEIVAAESPELILCDIGMPQCNGIEVLKYVSTRNYRHEFAFLTCYESFEYAREAVRYGATNYLTKPIDLKELREALLQMIATLRAKKRISENAANRVQRDTLRNNFFQLLRDGMYGEDRGKIEAAIQRHHFEMDADMRVRCLLVGADFTEALQKGWNRELLTYSFHYLAQEVIADRQDFSDSLVDIHEPMTNIVLFPCAAKPTEQEAVRRCRHLISVCRTHLSLQPVCLVGESIPLYQLPRVWPEMQRRFHKMRLQSGQVALFREPAGNAQEGNEPTLDETRTLDLIKRHDKAGYMGEISSIANGISTRKSGSDRAIALLHHDLVHVFSTYLQDNTISPHALFEDEAIRELDANAERSVFDMINFAACVYDYATAKLQKPVESDNVISKVKRYIAEHYRENIDRDTIAAIAFITPNYLSKCFRSEVGMNMREYINQLRIKESKRRLLSTDFSIGRIANDVGFENISYFSTVFRKQCGMSPADWRNRKGDGCINDEMDDAMEEG